MRTGRPKRPLILTEDEQEKLQSLAYRARSQAAPARRARVVLACGQGLANKSVAQKLRCSTISRIWRAFCLQPHRTDTFKLSPDPLLIEKVRDIVGLYMNPPDHALVFCLDEKSQIQALDRT